MSLANVNIVIGNGNLGVASLSDDGIAGLVLTGTATEKLELNKVYVLSSTADFKKYSIDEKTNPFLYKELTAFYNAAGDGAELHLLVVSEATTLTQICAAEEDAPLKKLISSAAGRIRLVGINRNTPTEYVPTLEGCIDADVVTAIAAAQSVADSFLKQVAPFRVLLPALGWNGETTDLYQPREGSYNRVAIVMASDGIFGESKLYSAAIGQVLGRAAKISVHQNIGRVRDGAIAAKGFLTSGKTPEEHFALWDLLDDAGYIFYRTFISKNGYYLNDDATATATTDDYCFLSYGRVIDKATILAYKTYIDDILDNIEVDPDKGTIPVPICKEFEAAIIRSVNTEMSGEISSFNAYINPEQDILTTRETNISLEIVPLGTLRKINISLSLKNPA
jgi:hypothetical protein bfra3_07042|nr:MAG TPA: tail sheath protein [Caudoviricetes sp.]